jgi:EmrB/QacA subfamily drug resistance transporter
MLADARAGARPPRRDVGSRAPGKWTVFAIVAVGVLMATIDSSIVNVSLPIIARGFGVPLGGPVEWVVIGYLVVVAALLLTAGRVADVVGRKVVWVSGLTSFTTASALCGAAPSLGALVAFRALQGVGAAMMMSSSPAMIVGAFPREQRGRALGMNAVVVGLGISAGPTLGGVITQHLGWRWIFFVNVPLGVGGIAAALHLLVADRRAGGGRIDGLGALLLAIGLGGLTGTLSFGSELSWTSAPILGGGAAAVAALVALAVHLGRATDPLVDPSLFRRRVFASSSASLLLCFVATFAVPFLMPFYLEQLRGWPAQRAGLLLTPLPLTIAVVGPLTGALADRIGTRVLAVGGLLLVSLGLVLLSFVDASTAVPRMVADLMLIGFGQAIFQPPNNSALMGSAPGERQGVAAGVLASSRVIGQSVAVALAGGVFATFAGSATARSLRHGVSSGLSGPAAQAFVRGMHGALSCCAAIAFVGAVVAIVRGRD